MQVPGYTSVRNDGSDGRKGGMVMSFLCVAIPPHEQKTFFIWTIYRTPELLLDNFTERMVSTMQLLPSDADMSIF